jgi:hypothetical protein
MLEYQRRSDQMERVIVRTADRILPLPRALPRGSLFVLELTMMMCNMVNFTLIYGSAAPKTRESRKNRTSVAVNEPAIRSRYRNREAQNAY